MFKKKNNLQTAIAIACMSASLSSYAALPAKPNVVTIMIDDMGFSDIGKFGGEIDTPNLDQFVTDGTQLTNYYSAPTSSPARAMFFTGRDAHPAGLGNMAGLAGDRPPQKNQPGYEGVLSPNLPTFPELLQRNGYHTIMAGKWHLGDKPGQYPSDRGFTNSLTLLPGGDLQYLSDASGQLITTYDPPYYARLVNPNPGSAPGSVTTPFNRNGLSIVNAPGAFPANAFSTDYYTDEALKFLDARTDKTKPFYIHLSHTAAHGPFQAPADLIAKYLPKYSVGWDKLRADRFAKLKSLGLIPQNAVLPPRDPEAKAWSKLTADEQKIEAKRMAVYAGMVEKLDQSVGKLVQHLKDTGQYDNTVFFVMSDNGSASVEPPFGPAREGYINANFTKANIASLATMGDDKSFINPTPGLGMLSNMPFNRFKTETFDGGVHTAAFMFAPKADVKSKGAKYNCLSSVMDISATILTLTGTKYPTTYTPAGSTTPITIAPIEGKSMKNVLAGDLTCKYPNRALGLELNGAKMMRSGDWKIAQQFDWARGRLDGHFYLFNMMNDPFEQHDLSQAYPVEYSKLLGLYSQYAQKNKVVNVGPRTFIAGGNLQLEPAVMKADGVTPDGMILGGSSVNYNTYLHVPTLPQLLPLQPLSAPKVGDMIDIAAEIYPPAIHQSKAGSVMVASYYKPATGAGQWTAFRRAYNTLGKIVSSVVPVAQTVDGSVVSPNFARIPTFSAPLSVLSTRIELPIYEGKLASKAAAGYPSFAAGTYYFWVGYKLTDGTVEHSAKPIVLTVTP